MNPGCKIFEFEVFRLKKFQLKTFKILGPCSWMLKTSIKMLFGAPNLQVENFNIPGHDPRMLTYLNSTFLDQKTSSSKFLKSWGHVLGY